MAANRKSLLIPSRVIGSDDNPWTAVQAMLLEITGLATNQWAYLSSYVINSDQTQRVEHFFCATSVQSRHDIMATAAAGHWIDLVDLKRALVDGRIALANHATAVALALIYLNQPAV